MDTAGLIIVVLANWIVIGSVILDLKTEEAFFKWRVRRSVKVVLIASLFWPLMWYHICHQGAKF